MDPRSCLGSHHSRDLGAPYASGLNELLLITAIIALAGGLLALVLIRTKDFIAYNPDGPGAPEPALVSRG